jgi:hypothetical protein
MICVAQLIAAMNKRETINVLTANPVLLNALLPQHTNYLHSICTRIRRPINDVWIDWTKLKLVKASPSVVYTHT